MPKAVGDFLAERGHEVIFLTDVLPQDAPDQVVARVSEINGCILVTQDHDFKTIAPRVPNGARGQVRRLSRISFSCPTPNCIARARDAISLIEFEWDIAQKLDDNQMIIVIRSESMRTAR